MLRLLKCYGTCEGKYTRENLISLSGKNHCLTCYETKIKETEDRNKLYQLLTDIFEISYPTGLMLKQIKEYRNDRKYSLKNIYFAVHYIANIKKISLQVRYGIALVPHYYDEMITYYKQIQERRSKMTDYNPTGKSITVRLSQPIINDDYKKKKLIDMENLLK